MARISIPVFVLLLLQGTTDFVFGAGGSDVVAEDQSVELAGNAMRIFFFAVGLVVASFAAAAAGFLYMSKRGIRWEFQGSEDSVGDGNH
ncbi:MAG: hypothetical protein CL771_08830 [Chloroflexi bacterium]|nr:hypothetical protein [Chloroflexota bacterium]MBK33697.1 hypothetical protein [Chloroflexota bacterium]|tara:strand:+ start:912 stop:1178 length:267 start_codon:yes stop_codon:yes gene_type:complete